MLESLIFLDIMCVDVISAEISWFWQRAITIHYHVYKFFGFRYFYYGFFIGSLSFLYCDTFRLRFSGFILSSISLYWGILSLVLYLSWLYHYISWWFSSLTYVIFYIPNCHRGFSFYVFFYWVMMYEKVLVGLFC